MSHIIARDINTAFRIAVLMGSVLFGVIVLIACAKTAAASSVMLHPSVTLTGGTLTAGDLFEGLNREQAARVLGPAPKPGSDMVLNTVTLMRIASALNVNWRPQTGTEQSVIRSAATIIGEDDITQMIAERLRQEGVDGDFVLNFMNTSPSIILPHTVAATAEIVTFTYNSKADRFTALLAAPSRENAAVRMEVSGLVDHLIEVPVLKNMVRNGDIINANDVDWIALSRRYIQHDTVLQADKLIGKTARRILETGKPVRGAELQMPQLVNRGENVTIIYQEGPLSLSAKGKALSGGAYGQVVRVVNSSSNRSIDAVVNDLGVVTVHQ